MVLVSSCAIASLLVHVEMLFYVGRPGCLGGGVDRGKSKQWRRLGSRSGFRADGL